MLLQNLQLQAVQSALKNNKHHVHVQGPRPKELNPCAVQHNLPVVQSEYSPDLHHAADLSPPSKTLQSAYVILTLWKWNMPPSPPQ